VDNPPPAETPLKNPENLSECLGPPLFLNVAIKAEFLKDLPLPTLTSQQRKQLTVLVDRILAAKPVRSTSNIDFLEREIDQLFYTAFELTPDEISIVGAAVPPSGEMEEPPSE